MLGGGPGVFTAREAELLAVGYFHGELALPTIAVAKLAPLAGVEDPLFDMNCHST